MSAIAGTSGANGDVLDSFYIEVKEIETRDSVLTSKQQIDRLLRPGSTYFNLNPFEVLQIDPDTPPEAAKKQYKKMSLLIHPDKNPDDRERADKAFGIVKKAVATIEDPDYLEKCKEIVVEAKARVQKAMDEQRKKQKREGKSILIEEDDPQKYKRAVWAMTNKLFADNERKRKMLDDRANDEKKRKAEESIELADAKRLQEEWAKNYDESRQERVGSWQKFVTKKEKKGKLHKGSFKPPKPKPEHR